MNYFIIIRGPLGVGKTTVAKKIACILGAKYYSVDDILIKYGLDRTEGDYEPADFLKANEIILPAIKKQLASGKTVIIEGNFYFKDQIEHLLHSVKALSFVFHLEASLETCIERDRERKLSFGEESAKAVYDLVEKLNYGEKIHTNSKTPERIAKEIISYLPVV